MRAPAGMPSIGTIPLPMPMARPNMDAANAFVRAASSPRCSSGRSTGFPVLASSARRPHAAGEPGISADFDASVLKYFPSRFSRRPSATHASRRSLIPRGGGAANSPASTRANTSQSIAAKRTALP